MAMRHGPKAGSDTTPPKVAAIALKENELEYTKIPTSPEVWAVIRARHGAQLAPFASFSDPDGTFNGGPGERGCMETAFGINGTEVPLLYAKTTWEIDPERPHKRLNEQHEYWLCIARADDA